MLRNDLTGTSRLLALALVAAVGVGAAILVALGNPGNMGICGACFLRDVSGALGLFSGKGPRIFRPEVLGIILGALIWTLARGCYGARSGSHAVTRFFFGAWMGIGALVFLGCPFRLLQRLGGGDLNALAGAVGLAAGVGIGVAFERRGYNLGRTAVVAPVIGFLGPVTFLLIAGLFLAGRLYGPGPGAGGSPAHAPWLASLAIAVVAGAILCATRFCVISAMRQIYGTRRLMLLAAAVLVAAYAGASLAAGNFRIGFESQPAAHGDGVWNVVSMVLVGLTGCLVGGCPVRQIVMTGEGNGDALVTSAGILVGGALSHSLGLASTSAGPTPAGKVAVAVGLLLAVAYAAAITAAARREKGTP